MAGVGVGAAAGAGVGVGGAAGGGSGGLAAAGWLEAGGGDVWLQAPVPGFGMGRRRLFQCPFGLTTTRQRTLRTVRLPSNEVCNIFVTSML